MSLLPERFTQRVNLLNHSLFKDSENRLNRVNWKNSQAYFVTTYEDLSPNEHKRVETESILSEHGEPITFRRKSDSEATIYARRDNEGYGMFLVYTKKPDNPQEITARLTLAPLGLTIVPPLETSFAVASYYPSSPHLHFAALGGVFDPYYPYASQIMIAERFFSNGIPYQLDFKAANDTTRKYFSTYEFTESALVLRQQDHDTLRERFLSVPLTCDTSLVRYAFGSQKYDNGLPVWADIPDTFKITLSSRNSAYRLIDIYQREGEDLLLAENRLPVPPPEITDDMVIGKITVYDPKTHSLV